MNHEVGVPPLSKTSSGEELVPEPQLCADFRNTDWWRQELPRFVGYAASQIALRSWRGNFGELPPGAPDGQDYVQEAVELSLRGSRHCPERVSSIAFVMMTIRSLIAHDFDRPENKRLHYGLRTAVDENAGKTMMDESSIGEAPSTPTAEDLVVSKERLADFMRDLPREYRSYVEMLISGCFPAADDRARALGVPISKIRNMDRVIRRLRSRWGAAPSTVRSKE